MFYTSLEHMCELYDQSTREYAFDAKTPQQYEEWKLRARKRLLEISGINQCRKTPLNPRMESLTDEDGMQKEYWIINTEPGISMPLWLFRPKKPNGAAIILPHGHGSGKDVYNRMLVDGKGYVAQLVEKGYFVACPDARGSGERREIPQQGDGEGDSRLNSHRELLNIAIGFGQSVIGLMVWDLMRLADFLESEPLIMAERIGCTGMSGGGQQALWLAALDDRISAAVTSGYFYGVKESHIKQPGNCGCNFVPNFWNTMDMGDLGALVAPRALLVESGRHDHLNGAPGLDNVYPQVETARRAFELLRVSEKLTHNVHEGKHEWKGIGVLSFLDRWLCVR